MQRKVVQIDVIRWRSENLVRPPIAEYHAMQHG
jgi:hypothetical protein